MERKSNLNILDKIKIILFFVYMLLIYIFAASAEKLKYSEAVLIVFCFLELLEMIKRKKIIYSMPIVILFIFVFYCFLSQFWAIDSLSAIITSKTLFLLTIFLLVSYNFFYRIKEGKKYLSQIIMWAGIVFSIYVILYYGINRYFSLMMSGRRVGGEVINSNSVGLYTSISVIIAMFFAIYENKKIYYLLTIIPLIVALGSGSRKVLIMIVLGTILLFLLNNEKGIKLKKHMKKILSFLAIIVIFIYIARLPIFSTIFKRFGELTNFISGQEEKGVDVRYLYIKAGLEQFLEKPILGIGLMNSGYITREVTGSFTYLHNNYVELLATTGIIGFCLYYSVYVYILYNSIKHLKKRDKYNNLVLTIFLVNIILEVGYVSFCEKNTYIYILFALIVLGKLGKEKLDEKDN